MAFCKYDFGIMLFPPLLTTLLTVRNVYLLVNYGNFVPDELTITKPFIQLLSTSNETSLLHSEFVQVRLNGMDTTATQQILVGSGSDIERTGTSFWTKSKIYIIVGAAVGVGLLIVSLILCCLCRCKSLGRSRGNSTTLWNTRSAKEYQPLNLPAPAAATDLHAAPSDYAPSTAYHPPQGSWNKYDDH